MESILLSASKRDKAVKAKDLRNNDAIPAEFYGVGKENMSLQLDYGMFRKAYLRSGENMLIDLDVDGDRYNVLVHEIQRHPVDGRITHVDFINVRMDKEVETNVPLHFVGESSAVKDASGTLITHLDELTVRCLPKDLLHSIDVDISVLVDFHSAIHVKDLNVPSGITVLNDLEQTVATVVPLTVEEEAPAEETPAAEGAGAAPAGEEAPKE